MAFALGVVGAMLGVLGNAAAWGHDSGPATLLMLAALAAAFWAGRIS